MGVEFAGNRRLSNKHSRAVAVNTWQGLPSGNTSSACPSASCCAPHSSDPGRTCTHADSIEEIAFFCFCEQKQKDLYADEHCAVKR